MFSNNFNKIYLFIYFFSWHRYGCLDDCLYPLNHITYGLRSHQRQSNPFAAIFLFANVWLCDNNVIICLNLFVAMWTKIHKFISVNKQLKIIIIQTIWFQLDSYWLLLLLKICTPSDSWTLEFPSSSWIITTKSSNVDTCCSNRIFICNAVEGKSPIIKKWNLNPNIYG